MGRVMRMESNRKSENEFKNRNSFLIQQLLCMGWSVWEKKLKDWKIKKAPQLRRALQYLQKTINGYLSTVNDLYRVRESPPARRSRAGNPDSSNIQIFSQPFFASISL